MIQGWFDGTDNDSLQQFAVDHDASYTQEIGLIDGMTAMAYNPREGEGHETKSE